MASQEREEYLNDDPDVPGQKFVLLSFLSPERVLAKKEIFLFDKFLNTFEFTFRSQVLEKFLMGTVKAVNDKLNAEADAAEEKDLSGVAQTIRDSRVRMDTLMDDLQKFIKGNQTELREMKLKEMYDEFYEVNRAKLEDEFFAKNEFRTTVRGLKVRGSYSSHEEAVARSKKLQRQDPLHNIFVAEVGKWLPWDPNANDVKEQEYAEDRLNTLMKKYKENEEAREAFEREARERKAAVSKRAAKVGIEKMEESATELAANSITEDAKPTQQYQSMFDGPADLALARKLEREAEK